MTLLGGTEAAREAEYQAELDHLEHLVHLARIYWWTLAFFWWLPPRRVAAIVQRSLA